MQRKKYYIFIDKKSVTSTILYFIETKIRATKRLRPTIIIYKLSQHFYSTLLTLVYRYDMVWPDASEINRPILLLLN